RSLLQERAPDPPQRGLVLRPDLRVSEAEVLERRDDRAGDDQSREPLVVGGNDVPRSPRRARLADHLLVRRLVLVPILPLVRVGDRELPVLVRVVEALEEAPRLLLLRDVKEELPDERPVAREEVLEVVDVPEAVLPDLLRDQLRRQLLLVEDLAV